MTEDTRTHQPTSQPVAADEDAHVGRLSASDGKGVVRIEQSYATTVEDLWSAIIDPDRLGRWYGRVDGDLRPGGHFRTHIEGADIDGTGRILACEPPTRLLVTTRETDASWRRGKSPGPFDETVEATLTADGDQTRLVLQVRGLPLDRLAAYGAGWQIHTENLTAYLRGAEPSDPGARWGALLTTYERLASDLGE